MDAWKYRIERRDGSQTARCAEANCSGVAVYRVEASRGDGDTVAGRDYCLNHGAASAFRLGLMFPPVKYPTVKARK